MKRFFFWLIGVLCGVGLFFAAVVGFSWYTTGPKAMPDPAGTAFGGVALEQNGYCWQVPLIGALADRVFAESNTLTAQKLGQLTDAHPALTVPDWADPAQVQLTLRNQDTDQVVFTGSLAEYEGFRYETNGNYLAELYVWRMPAGMTGDMLAKPTAKLVKNPRLEQPARPAGWYGYRFGFTLQANPQVQFSAETMRQGDVVAVYVTGLLGDQPPVLQSELSEVSFQPVGSGWIGYLGAAYNADAKTHTVTVTMADLQTETKLRVTERNFGQAEAVEEPPAPEGADAQFRDKIWPLYTAPSGPRQWITKWEKPVAVRGERMGYGMYQMQDGKQGRKSNSTVYATQPGMPVITPTAGTVVFADELLLTGKTVVIDHGCGVRSYLYGLEDITVDVGDVLAMSNPVGTAGELLTFDVKLGRKSINPNELFEGNGGLFAGL